MNLALRNYRVVAPIVAAFVVLFAALLLSGQPRDTTRDYSIFRMNRWGGAALAELLRTVPPRLSVRALTEPLDNLTRTHGLIAILDPQQPFGDEEVTELVRWVDRGGTLLIGAEGLWDDPASLRNDTGPPYVKLAAAFGVAARRAADIATEADPVPGSPLAVGVRRVAVSTQYAVAPLDGEEAAQDWAREEMFSGKVRCLVPHSDGDLTPHLAGLHGTVLASFRHGRGTVYFSSDLQWLSNGLLAREDNVALAGNLFWRHAAGGTVHFDEYHHGFGPRRLAASAVDPGPLQRAALVVLAGCVVLLLGKAVRFGAPVPAFDQRRRAAVEHVEALARLWMQAEARQWALSHVVAAFRRRVASAVGLPPTASAEVVALALAQRRQIPAEETLSLLGDLETALKASEVGKGEAARLVERITVLEARSQPPGRAKRATGK